MFRKFLNKQLTKHNWTQRELSGKLGIDESLVSRWMKEERVPTLPNIIKLSNLFSVSVDEILQIMGKMETK